METDPKSIFKADKDAAYFNQLGHGKLPERMGIEIVALEANQVKGRVAITESHLAPNGILHAAVATSLADVCCGYGTIASLPEGAQGHATIELKCNFVSAVDEGVIVCVAAPLHFGKRHPRMGRTCLPGSRQPLCGPFSLHANDPLAPLTIRDRFSHTETRSGRVALTQLLKSGWSAQRRQLQVA